MADGQEDVAVTKLVAGTGSAQAHREGHILGSDFARAVLASRGELKLELNLAGVETGWRYRWLCGFGDALTQAAAPSGV